MERREGKIERERVLKSVGELRRGHVAKGEVKCGPHMSKFIKIMKISNPNI